MFPIPNGSWAVQFVEGADSTGARLPLATVSATVDDYTSAYVADLPSSANATRYALVPRASLGAGVVKTVTVTIHATSQDGTAIPPTTQQFQVSGAAPPPQATQLTLAAPTIGSGGLPADPGSPSATLTPF